MEAFPASFSYPLPPLRQRRLALASGLAMLWWVFTLLAQFSGALDELEEPLLDWRQTLAAYPVPPSDQIALVAIDNIPADHPWPWPRLDYSLLLRSLIDYLPNSVVFEMNLNDRDTQYNAFDSTLGGLVERANTVVFAGTVLTAPDTNPIPKNIATIPVLGDTHAIPRFGSAIWPYDTFAGGSPIGINNLQAESNLTVRRIPLVFLLRDQIVPSLVLQAAAQILGADLPSSEVQLGRAVFLRRKDLHIMRIIPIDDEGRLRIRFHRSPAASWQASFDNILVYADDMNHGLTPDKDLRQLTKRQVWIGRTDPDQIEQFNTSLGKLSRIEVELQAMRTILSQDYVRKLPPVLLAIAFLIVAIGGAAACVQLGPYHGAALLFLALTFWVESSVLSFRLYNIIFPLCSFTMLVVGTYVVGFLALFWDLETEPEQKV